MSHWYASLSSIAVASAASPRNSVHSSNALDLDAAYILNGEQSSAYDCVKIIGTASNNEVADMLTAMAKTLRTREKNITRIDYKTKEGIVIETRKKK